MQPPCLHISGGQPWNRLFHRIENKLTCIKIKFCYNNRSVLSARRTKLRLFWLYSYAMLFWDNFLFILWFSLILHCLHAGFVLCPCHRIMVPVVISSESEHFWSLLRSTIFAVMPCYLIAYCHCFAQRSLNVNKNKIRDFIHICDNAFVIYAKSIFETMFEN